MQAPENAHEGLYWDAKGPIDTIHLASRAGPETVEQSPGEQLNHRMRTQYQATAQEDLDQVRPDLEDPKSAANLKETDHQN